MTEYFERETSPLNGYFSLVTEFVSMMLKNGSGDDINDFLYEAGRNLAEQFPVKTRDSLSALHLEINSQLGFLGFGTAQIEDIRTGIQVVHRNIRPSGRRNFDKDWLKSFAVILCGLYNGWFRQTGSPEALFCKIEELRAPDEAVFVLKKRV